MLPLVQQLKAVLPTVSWDHEMLEVIQREIHRRERWNPAFPPFPCLNSPGFRLPGSIHCPVHYFHTSIVCLQLAWLKQVCVRSTAELWVKKVWNTIPFFLHYLLFFSLTTCFLYEPKLLFYGNRSRNLCQWFPKQQSREGKQQ